LTATLPDARLPAHLEVSALLRATESAGGFATVLKKGEREGGTILVVLCENGTNARAFERMPGLNGARSWTCSKVQDVENKREFQEYLDRRARQDPDLWMIELDVANGERLIASP
jgi:hypothetical protein